MLHTWQHILLSDESRFSLRVFDGRYRVYPHAWGTFYGPVCVRDRGGSVMVWAGICYDDRTQIKIVQGTLNVVKYRNDILNPIVLPFLQ